MYTCMSPYFYLILISIILYIAKFKISILVSLCITINFLVPKSAISNIMSCFVYAIDNIGIFSGQYWYGLYILSIRQRFLTMVHYILHVYLCMWTHRKHKCLIFAVFNYPCCTRLLVFQNQLYPNVHIMSYLYPRICLRAQLPRSKQHSAVHKPHCVKQECQCSSPGCSICKS